MCWQSTIDPLHPKRHQVGPGFCTSRNFWRRWSANTTTRFDICSKYFNYNSNANSILLYDLFLKVCHLCTLNNAIIINNKYHYHVRKPGSATPRKVRTVHKNRQYCIRVCQQTRRAFIASFGFVGIIYMFIQHILSLRFFLLFSPIFMT